MTVQSLHFHRFLFYYFMYLSLRGTIAFELCMLIGKLDKFPDKGSSGILQIWFPIDIILPRATQAHPPIKSD